MDSKLHKSKIKDHEFIPKEGQRGLLCSNNCLSRCPSLSYELIELNDDIIAKVNKAFDLLFEQVIKNRKNKNYEINCSIRQSINL